MGVPWVPLNHPTLDITMVLKSWGHARYAILGKPKIWSSSMAIKWLYNGYIYIYWLSNRMCIYLSLSITH